MIKMQTPNFASLTMRSLTSFKQSQNCQKTLNLLPISIPKRSVQVEYNQTQIITVSLNQSEKHKQILKWRQNTEFPIVKVKSYKLLEKKHDVRSGFLEILIQLESQMKKLKDMKKLPFFQAIYILKESMIGFQRLCHRFGFFKVQPEMIMLNENQNCKVWISKYWYLSDIEPSEVKSEKEFIFELCKVVEEKTAKSKISCDFFEKIQNCKYFFEAIGSIEMFAKVNIIKIPTKLQNLEEIKTPLVRTSSTIDSNRVRVDLKKNKIKVWTKIPRFIKKVQVNKLHSQEIYTPLPRKVSMATQICANDRSFTNVSRNNSSNSFLKNDYQGNRIEERENATIDEDSFLKDLNIRLIEPNGLQKKNEITSPQKFYQEYTVNTPQTFSPLAMVSEIDLNQDKNSGFSFNKDIKKHEPSSFEAVERMFLTVCRETARNRFFSPIKKNKPDYSPRDIRTLQYLDTQDAESFQDFQEEPNQNKFMPLTINQIKQKRKLSGDFGKSSGKLGDEEIQVQGQQEIYTPKYSTANLLNVPRPSQSNLRLIKSPTHQIINQRRKNMQDQELEEEEKEQQEREFLRENIMNLNGWKGLSILQHRKPIQQSFINGNEIIPILNQAKTSQLLKLGMMGREVKTSMINDDEFKLEYGGQIEKEKSVRNDLMGLLD